MTGDARSRPQRALSTVGVSASERSPRMTPHKTMLCRPQKSSGPSSSFRAQAHLVTGLGTTPTPTAEQRTTAQRLAASPNPAPQGAPRIAARRTPQRSSSLTSPLQHTPLRWMPQPRRRHHRHGTRFARVSTVGANLTRINPPSLQLLAKMLPTHRHAQPRPLLSSWRRSANMYFSLHAPSAHLAPSPMPPSRLASGFLRRLVSHARSRSSSPARSASGPTTGSAE